MEFYENLKLIFIDSKPYPKFYGSGAVYLGKN